MKPLNKKIEELKKEIEETKGNEIIGFSECKNCGCELLEKQKVYCEKCNQMKLQAYEEAKKIIDEKVKELKEKILDYDVIDPKLSLFLVNIQERFTVDVDKIFGGKNDL